MSSRRCLHILMVCFSVVLVLPAAVPAVTILFHGDGVSPVDGDVGAMARLESTYGAGNVTYMQGSAAAADGSDAAGFDAIVISSTLLSGTLRNKYEDATQGVMNWENALMRQRGGEFNMAENGSTGGTHSQLNIVAPTHPLAASLPAGLVTVTTAPATMSYGTGALAPGATLVASIPAGGHGIYAADVGDVLLGDGTAGNPATAPGRRVMFFLHDTNFDDLTTEGLALFDAAVTWVVPEPATLLLCGLGLVGLLSTRRFRR